jgi:quercetin dioxygenase-like cupin family protein
MMNRRDAVAALAVFAEVIAQRGLAAQTPARGAGQPAQPAAAGAAQAPARPPVFTHDLPNVSLDGWEVTVSIVDYAPGRVGAAHKHPGFVLAYVLEGSVIAKISGQGDEKTYKTGEMFYEQPGAVHEVSKNASATVPARLLAMVFHPKGATLTTPVQQ